MKRYDYYIWGWHGHRNFGDDVFAIVVSWGLRKFLSGRRIYMDQDISGSTHESSITTSVRSTDRLPFAGRVRRWFHRHQSDCFVLAGGNLLPSIEQVRSISQDRHWFQGKRRAIGLGISVGPFESEQHESETASLLNRFQFVSFRDHASHHWASQRSLKVPFELCCDLAVLLPTVSPSPMEAAEGTSAIGVSLISHHLFGPTLDPELESAFVVQLAESTANCARKYEKKIRVFALCTNPDFDDERISRRFASACDGLAEVHLYRGDANATFHQIQSCSHFVSMRLHGAVVCYAAGIPFLMLSYHPKCKEFANFVGSPEGSCMDVRGLDLREYERQLDLMLQTEGHRSALSIPAAQQSAVLSFTRAAEVLKRGTR